MDRVQLLDVDGVLASFTGHALQTAGSELTLADITQWDLFALMGEKGAEAKKALKDPDWWLDIPVMPGAQDAVEDYRYSSRVVCATAPWVSCKGWGWARRKWLKKHFDIGNSDVIITSDKSLIEADGFVDDKPETVAAWQHRHPFGDACLFNAPYNADIELLVGPFKRVYGWPNRRVRNKRNTET